MQPASLVHMKSEPPRTGSQHRASLLRLDHYPANYPVHVTIGTHRRRAFFSSPKLAQVIFRVLKTHERTLAAVLMPDHVHWVIDCCQRAPEALTEFKSLTTRLAGKHGVEGALWQRSYFDHVLRDHESLAKTVRYVLGNPIRDGLTGQLGEYRWAYDRFGLAD